MASTFSKSAVQAARGCLLAALVACGCGGPDPRIAAERGRFELAEMTGDLDAMFIASRTLADLGDEVSVARLPRVKRAIDLREMMRRAVGDHDHEAAIGHASLLLKEVPKHVEAVKVLRESGQIFWYLSAAHELTMRFATGAAEVASFPDDALDVTLPQDEHEIPRLAQSLLQQLGYDPGPVDGVVGDRTNHSLEWFWIGRGKKYEDATQPVDRTLIAELMDELQKRQRDAAAWKDTEERFLSLVKARQYVIKARILDPQFRSSANLETRMSQAQDAFIVVRADEAVRNAQFAVELAASLHDTLGDALRNAISSRYGSVSDTWARLDPFVDTWKAHVKVAYLNIVERNGNLLAQYSGGEAENYVREVREFLIASQNTIEALVVPLGSYRDFVEAATRAIEDYKVKRSRLQQAIPSGGVVADNFGGLAKVLSEYKVFDKPETRDILEAHRSLFEL